MNVTKALDALDPVDALITCPLCSEPAALVFSSHHAYVAPDRFDVHECPNCDARFAWPMRARTEVYDQIYACREELPGYARYERMRRAVVDSPDPLLALTEVEDVYWGVSVALKEVVALSKLRGTGAPRVLELGTGMGYLTHALLRHGFIAEGWDISTEAVNQARLHFGAYFRVVDASQPLDRVAKGKRYDAIVATELIEHLENPQDFVRQAARLLAPGGRLIVTTPNRDIYPPSMAWHTDPAPVHLWWFSKASLRRMAWAADMSVNFVDFGPFYGKPKPPTRASKPQPIDAGGKVIFKDSVINTFARAIMARWPAASRHIGRIFLLQQSERAHRERSCRESLSMCAVLMASRAPMFDHKLRAVISASSTYRTAEVTPSRARSLISLMDVARSLEIKRVKR